MLGAQGLEQIGIFIVPHLLWHGASVFKVISERPVSAVLLAKEQSLPILNVLGLTRPVRAGLQLTNYRLLSESTTTRLRQLAGSIFLRKCRNNIQISSSHISLTDVIFTEVFEATLDIYNVYNMLFWSPTFYHQLRFKVLTNLEIRRFFSISSCVYRKWRTNKLKVCEEWTNARLLSLQVSFVCLYSLLRKRNNKVSICPPCISRPEKKFL